MPNYFATEYELTSIANAIRSKTGDSSSLVFPQDFIAAINSITGGSSGGGNAYVRTEICPLQTINPDSNRGATLTHTERLYDGYYYIVTFDNVEWITTCETLWTENYCIGDIGLFFSSSSDVVNPFGIIWTLENNQSILEIRTKNTNQHTIKIERLEFVDGPLKFKSITQNGTYSAEDDNAAGYRSVTVNVAGGGNISIVDQANATGTTAVVTGTSGGGSATQHTIYLEFSDSTSTTIPFYCDDTLLNTMITSYTPTTYNNKTVDLAQLDNVTWYTRPTATWETLFTGIVNYYPDNDNDYPYCWLESLGSVQIQVGSVWRVTYDNVQYICTAGEIDSGIVGFGNPKWSQGTDDGSGVPFSFYNTGYGAWSGSINASNDYASRQITIERQLSA